MSILSVNPATEKTLQEFDALSDREIEQKLHDSVDAFARQKSSSFDERKSFMHKAADLLDAESGEWAAIMTAEMGKTLRSAKAEAEKCAWVCRFYADHAEEFLADETVATEATNSFKRYLPLGPVLAVMPWNFPFWQVFRFAAPALMAGNTGLLKHASNVPQSALGIEEIFRRAGFPHAAFQTLLIGSDKVEPILRDHRVRAATLTGSGQAGASVAAIAGKQIKKTVLELGGSDPFIVMPSADLEKAVKVAVTARTQNNGQSCIAAKRFIVHRDVFGEFRDAFVAGFEALKIGDPTADDTDIGPLATADGREDCDQLVKKVLDAGGQRLTGAEIIEGTGYFYRPGILEVPADDAEKFDDEIFGPVSMLFEARNLEQAVHIGNATPFGLGSTIFTNDAAEREYACNELEAGATFVNAMVASHPKLPFGGVKASGYGRELSTEGIREFTNIKTIFVK